MKDKDINELIDEVKQGKAEIRIIREIGDDGFIVQCQANGEDMIKAYKYFTICLYDCLKQAGMSDEKSVRMIADIFLKATEDYFDGNYKQEKMFNMSIPREQGGAKKC